MGLVEVGRGILLCDKQEVSLGFVTGQQSLSAHNTTYTLVPRGIGKGNQISIRILWLGLGRWWHRGIGGVGLLGSWRGSWRRCRLGSRFGGLLSVQRADLQLTLVLLQNALIVIFPELLGSIFSGDSLENCATVNFGLVCKDWRTIMLAMTYSSFHLENISS